MSMIYITEELRSCLYPTYTNATTSEIMQDKSRLVVIKRTRPNFFHPELRKGEEVGLLEAYQDWNDVRNEFRGLFIKPLMCEYLVVKHALDLCLEIVMAVVNCITGSRDLAVDSLCNAFVELLRASGYQLNAILTGVTVAPIFVIRAITSLFNQIRSLVASQEVWNQFERSEVVETTAFLVNSEAGYGTTPSQQPGASAPPQTLMHEETSSNTSNMNRKH